MKLLLIGALPPPTGGDAIWMENVLNSALTKDIKMKNVNTSFIGRRTHSLGKAFRLTDEMRRARNIWWSTLTNVLFFKPNIVHLNSNCSPLGVVRDFLTMLIVNMSGIPLIMHCHSNVSDSIGNSKIGIAFLRGCLNRASKVLVLNAQSQVYCNQLSGVTCEILPNFIGEDRVSEVKIIHPRISNVVFVGHIIKTKGVIEVFEVAKRFPEISFIMAGTLTSDIVDIIIPPNIALIGNVEKAKLKDILDCADIFLFPTHTEGFSMALLEAMASGLPIITTSVGANEEMLENQGGILASVGAVDEMCSALNKLQCPILRKQMSVWNISKVRNSYSAPTVIGRLKCLFNSLLKN